MQETTPPVPFGLDRRAVLDAARALLADTGQYIPDAGSAPRSRRLGMRGWSSLDAGDLLELESDPRVRQHVIDAGVQHHHAAIAFMAIANTLAVQRPGLGLWRTGLRCDDRFIGYFLLAPDPRGRVELGAHLLPTAWGRGYALEGAAALCSHAFGRAGLSELWGFCHPLNRAVPLVLRRLHFRPLGECRHLGQPALGFRLDAATWHANPRPAAARETLAAMRQARTPR